jgi:hypothetical protein
MRLIFSRGILLGNSIALLIIDPRIGISVVFVTFQGVKLMNFCVFSQFKAISLIYSLTEQKK